MGNLRKREINHIAMICNQASEKDEDRAIARPAIKDGWVWATTGWCAYHWQVDGREMQTKYKARPMPKDFPVDRLEELRTSSPLWSAVVSGSHFETALAQMNAINKNSEQIMAKVWFNKDHVRLQTRSCELGNTENVLVHGDKWREKKGRKTITSTVHYTTSPTLTDHIKLIGECTVGLNSVELEHAMKFLNSDRVTVNCIGSTFSDKAFVFTGDGGRTFIIMQCNLGEDAEKWQPISDYPNQPEYCTHTNHKESNMTKKPVLFPEDMVIQAQAMQDALDAGLEPVSFSPIVGGIPDVAELRATFTDVKVNGSVVTASNGEATVTFKPPNLWEKILDDSGKEINSWGAMEGDTHLVFNGEVARDMLASILHPETIPNLDTINIPDDFEVTQEQVNDLKARVEQAETITPPHSNGTGKVSVQEAVRRAMEQTYTNPAQSAVARVLAETQVDTATVEPEPTVVDDKEVLYYELLNVASTLVELLSKLLDE